MQPFLNHVFWNVTFKSRDFKNTIPHTISRVSKNTVLAHRTAPNGLFALLDGVLEKSGQVTDLPLQPTILCRGGSVTHPLWRFGDLA